MAALIDDINAFFSLQNKDKINQRRHGVAYEYYGRPLCNRLLHAFFAHTEEEKSEQ
jgi:hypothetical protein